MTAPKDQYVNIDGIQTRYWQAGSKGSAVILLHGISCSVCEWHPNIASLSSRHRVFALDLMGHGFTDKPKQETYTIARLAKFTLDFLNAVDITQAHFVGNSLGGRLALECARSEPDRIASMVLVAPAGVDRDVYILFRLATVPFLGALLTKPNHMGLKMLWSKAFQDQGFVTDELIKNKLALATMSGSQKAFLKTLRSFVSFRGFKGGQVELLQAGLPTIKTPTLVIWGKHDTFLSVNHAEILRDRLPDAQVQVFDNCGHLPQIECTERFNNSVLDFWNNVDTKSQAGRSVNA